MANAVFLYDNFADSAVLSGGSWRSSLPLINVQHPDVGRVARSTNATAGSTTLSADLGTVEAPVGGVAIGPVNVTPGASWRLSAYDDIGQTTQVYDSGAITFAGNVVDSLDLEWEDPGFWLGIIDFGENDILPVYGFHVLPTDRQARFWRVEISDAANSAGYIDIGRLMIARAWRPSLNYTAGDNSFGIEVFEDEVMTLGGRKVSWERAARRTWRCSFSMLPEAEAWEHVLRIMMRVRLARQIFVIPDPGDLQRRQQRSFLGRYRQVPAIQQVLHSISSTVFDVEEVL
jgi:hypothetical protein